MHSHEWGSKHKPILPDRELKFLDDPARWDGWRYTQNNHHPWWDAPVNWEPLTIAAVWIGCFVFSGLVLYGAIWTVVALVNAVLRFFGVNV
jgi:hypothetical protein